MTRLLIKNFLRSKGLLLGLLLLLGVGFLSLHVGHIYLERQVSTVEKTAQFQEENLQRYLKYIDSDLGLLLYYVRFGLVNETSRISGLSIGHRDIHPSVKSVNIRNLEEQKYSSELVNPFYQLLGNMDFSFVLIYLFPLIIIAFCFNLLSEEKEGGTWKLIVSQSPRPLSIIKTKLWIRLVSIFMVFFVLLVIGKFYLDIPLDTTFLAFLITGLLYLAFWFALVWLVISWQRSSQQNAMLLLFTWLALTIILPASVNALVINLYPIPEAYSTILDSREGYHEKWDKPKEPTINKFKEHYPQFTQYQHPEGKSFSWFWYFAMQQMGDDEAAKATAKMKRKLLQRNSFSRTIGYFLPTIHTQFSLNELGHSGFTNYLNFLNSLEAFHEEKRLYFYPKIFDGQGVDTENWEEFGLEYFKDSQDVNWLVSLLPVLFATLIFWSLASLKWKSSTLSPLA